MARIELTLHVDYQSRWGLIEAAREIISNAMDGEARGKALGEGKMSVEYFPRSNRLVVINEKTKVPTSALLMGMSQSRNRDDCIGTFGEGLPMALLTLARRGFDVQVINGDEKWEPEIVRSEAFGEPVLSIRTRKIQDRGRFEVEINGVDPDEAASIYKLFLKLDPSEAAHNRIGGVLMDPEYKGRIYNKGVYVTAVPDFVFGYDVDMEVNRDRSFVDPAQLREQTSVTLREAVEHHPEKFTLFILPRLLSAGVQELGEAYDGLYYSEAFRRAVRKYYEKRLEGQDVTRYIAVTQGNIHRVPMGSNHLLLVMPELVYALMGRLGLDIPTVDEVVRERAQAPSRFYSSEEEPRLYGIVQRVKEILSREQPQPESIQIVDFRGGEHHIRWTDELVLVSRPLAGDPVNLLLHLAERGSNGYFTAGQTCVARMVCRAEGLL